MRHEPAAVGHAPARDADDAAVGQLLDARGHLAEIVGPAADEALRVLDVIVAVGEAVVEDLPHRRAGLHLLGRQPVHLGVAPVAHDQPLLGIEHGDALQHVLQRRVELDVLRLELVLALPQQIVLVLQLAVGMLERVFHVALLADVLVRGDPAAAGNWMVHHLDDAAVGQMMHGARLRIATHRRQPLAHEFLRRR